MEFMCTIVCMHAPIYIRMYLLTCIAKSTVHTHEQMYIHTLTYTYVCAYVCTVHIMYIYVYVHVFYCTSMWTLIMYCTCNTLVVATYVYSRVPTVHLKTV